ncbi:glycosyltransferase family 1 protein [Rubellicoccus peritrichatus]|uniref:Glycosyltransferase family 1 protein n=1 Tax=Rubellicoccus peritrichatus TaxID=3080537 RepID=A0AAQ3QR09_9BACT|nr:glycosyltransferase family 1 protein [Puniceicoccus sp. CR14]WOO40823.1 glycosyltransferase family 1 protein [Puniceicoccus sp. CR14]
MPKVLLVRNYAADGQESMLRFADMLEGKLPGEGWEVLSIAPEVRLGKGQNTLSGKGKWLSYIDKYILAPSTFKRAAKDLQPDIVHVCDHSNAMYLPHFSNYPRLVNCHDLLAIRVWLGEVPGESKSRIGGVQQKWIFSNLRKSPNISCISQATRDELTRLAPETEPYSRVIPMGLNYPYQKIRNEEARKRIEHAGGLRAKSGVGFPEQWLLHVGGGTWYKNRSGAIEIFRKLLEQSPNKELGLVIAGAPPSDKILKAAIGLENRITFIACPDNATLEALYSMATLFIFPSLAEGFGWPPIEAQACGCPVAVSEIEPLKSNCGSAAIYYDPKQTESAAKQIATVIHDRDALNELSEAGMKNAKRFTAQTMVAAYSNFYHQIINENTASR